MDVQRNISKRRLEGAFVTFLAVDGDYIKGVIGLAKALGGWGPCTVYPLIVAVLEDVPDEHREILRLRGGKCCFAMPYYFINYSKLRIWSVSI